METGIVSRITDGFFRYQGWSTVCKDENGVLYSVSSGHRLGHVCPFGKNLMCISRDEGKTWSEPMIVNDTPFDDRDGGIVSLGGGRMLLTYFNNPCQFYFDNEQWVMHDAATPTGEALAKAALDGWKTLDDPRTIGGSYVKISDDYGMSWKKTVRVQISSPHGPRLLKDGRILYVGTASYKDDPELVQRHIYAFESKDRGESWQLISEVPLPKGISVDPKNCQFCEPNAIELLDGTIVVAIRADISGVANGLTVFTCRSEDGGKTWSEPQSLDCCGAPPHFLLHSSGALVLCIGRRKEPFGIRALISYDGGKTWGEEKVLYDGPSPDGDLGYPSSVELSDGSILTTYYYKYPGDKFNSILYTKWKLD